MFSQREYNKLKKEIQSSKPSWDKEYCRCVELLNRAEKDKGKNSFKNAKFCECWEDYKKATNLVRYGER